MMYKTIVRTELSVLKTMIKPRKFYIKQTFFLNSWFSLQCLWLIFSHWKIKFVHSFRSSHHKCFIKKDLLIIISQNSQESSCARIRFLIKFCKLKSCSFIKKQTLVLVFSYEFCKIFENTFLTEHLRITAYVL